MGIWLVPPLGYCYWYFCGCMYTCTFSWKPLYPLWVYTYQWDYDQVGLLSLTFWGTAKSSSTAQIPVNPYWCHARWCMQSSASCRSCPFQNDWHPVEGCHGHGGWLWPKFHNWHYCCRCLCFLAVRTAFIRGYLFCSWCVVCQCTSSSQLWRWPEEELLTAAVRRGCTLLLFVCLQVSTAFSVAKVPFPRMHSQMGPSYALQTQGGFKGNLKAWLYV